MLVGVKFYVSWKVMTVKSFQFFIILFCFTLYIICFIMCVMETVATNIRIDKQLKEQSSQILEGLGLSLSGAINMFLRQIILQDGIPFKVEYPKPSRSLKKAIKEGEKLINDPKAKTYKTPQELWDEIGL